MAMAAAPLELVRLQPHPQQQQLREQPPQQQQPQQEQQEQEMLWNQLFADMSQWWDFRRSKSSPRYPDFKHKQSKLPLWLNSRHKPGWVDARLAALDAAAAAAAGPGPPPLGSPAPPAPEVELCLKLCAEGRLREAVDAAAQLVQERGCRLPSTLLYRLLKRCRQDNAGGLGLGRRVHALAAASGLRGDAFLATQLMGLYGAHGQLEDAMAAFEEVAAPDAYNWATIIFALAGARRGGGAGADAAGAERAVQLYRRMCEQSPDVEPDDRVYAAVLKACGAARDLRTGRQVHARMVAAGGGGGRPLGAFAVSGLVSMYAKCGSVEEARRVLEQAQAAGERGGAGVEAWNALMAGYAQQGMGREAVRLYTEMTEVRQQQQQRGGSCSPNAVTFVCALQACAGMGPGGLEHGKCLHADLCERGGGGGGGGWFLSSFRDDDGVVLGGSLVNMYAKCGSVEDARGVFDQIPGAKKNVVTWTALIAGYARHGMGRDALDLYKRMSSSSTTTATLAAPDSVTYVCLLQACAGVGALDEGRRLHWEICHRGLLLQQPPPGTTTTGTTAGVLGGSLVNMYAKCGSLEEARRVLDELPDAERNVVAWTALVAGYAQHGRGQDALDLYKRMMEEGGGGLAAADSVTYVCLLQACASVGVGALDVGRRLHAQMEEQEEVAMVADEMVAASVVNMYVKCGSLEDARRVLDELREVVPKEKLAASTNVMIAGYAQHGMGDQALALYYHNDDSGVALDAFSAASLLQACAGMGPAGLSHGHRLRAHAQRLGLLDTDAVVGASLVNMLAKCGGSMDEARGAWDALPEAARRDGVAWTAMVAGYARHGMARHALALYDERRGPSTDPVTCVCLLHVCASVGVEALDVGRRLHAQVAAAAAAEGWDADTAVVVGCSLVNMYAKCGHVRGARAVFDRMRRRNVVTWNTMLGGYAKHGMGREALALYHTMTTEEEPLVAPDAVTYVCALRACASVGAAALDDGRRLHAQVDHQLLLLDDDVVAASVVNMYAKCGDLAEARRVLDGTGTGGVVAWTALMAGYAQAGAPHQALALYARMRRHHPRLTPTAVTYTCVLQACAAVAAHELGQQVHAEIQGLVCVPHLPKLLPHHRQQQGAPRESVSAALVHMYAKCGDMAAAHAVFTSSSNSSSTTSPAAWGALLCGYARHGDAPAGLALLRRMRAQGVAPDAVTFLAALTLCAHAGLVDRGRAILASMQADYGLAPAKEHVTCVVDMLGRAGRLHEAVAVASSAAAAGTNTTTSTTGPATWHALLGACGKWGDVETGRRALAMAEAAGQADAAAYVLMANVYAGAGDAQAAQAVRARARLPLVGVGGEEEAGAGGGGAEDGGKPPGESWWTDPDSGLVHTFRAGG